MPSNATVIIAVASSRGSDSSSGPCSVPFHARSSHLTPPPCSGMSVGERSAVGNVQGRLIAVVVRGGWREANWLPLEISCDMVGGDEAATQRWLGRPRFEGDCHCFQMTDS